MLAKTYSAQIIGLRPVIIDVELDISRGFHAFSVVGLPDQSVEESRDRLSAAIKHSGFGSPQKSNKKIVVALAPADVKKEGPIFDLAMALAYLLANGEAKFEPAGRLFLGELALDGSLRPIKGVLLIAQAAAAAGFRELYVPTANAAEAALIADLTVYGAANLREVTNHLAANRASLTRTPSTALPGALDGNEPYDLADIKGQATAKRGLEIAAAGGHNIAMFGPPGTGKTMLARAFTALLPTLDFNQVLEVTGIHSAAGVLSNTLITRPPFRAPHHTASYVSLVGGGTWPRPGEITLAHRGVLFLDEFPEFEKRVIESLRQPLEEHTIQISRARGSMTFPAQFILIAAMNPCPCGHHGSTVKECICSPSALYRYQRRISGPIIDRIDLWLEVGPVDHRELGDDTATTESSAAVKQRVIAARARQAVRLAAAERPLGLNSEMGVRDLKKLIKLDDATRQILNQSAARLGLSARSYHRVIKLARTIADLAGAEDIKTPHILEALQYRPKSFV